MKKQDKEILEWLRTTDHVALELEISTGMVSEEAIDNINKKKHIQESNKPSILDRYAGLHNKITGKTTGSFRNIKTDTYKEATYKIPDKNLESITPRSRTKTPTLAHNLSQDLDDIFDDDNFEPFNKRHEQNREHKSTINADQDLDNVLDDDDFEPFNKLYEQRQSNSTINADKDLDNILDDDDFAPFNKLYEPIKHTPLKSQTLNLNNDITSPFTAIESTQQSPHKPLVEYEWDRNVQKALTQVFKLERFRQNQHAIINAILTKRDVFVLMPTGGGKSLCFQLPAVLGSGVTFVISPLLSLIQDQVRGLVKRGCIALCLTGSLTQKEKNMAYNDLSRETPLSKLFYITPELIMNSERFRQALTSLYMRQKIERIVIDESHCVSQWGHDFRPDYKELKNLRKEFGGVQFVSLTATATGRVQTDIIANLGMISPIIFTQSFNRANLSYMVVPKTSNIYRDIVSFIRNNYINQSGIIYCLTKKECESLSLILTKDYGIKAHYYHAGLESGDRSDIQNMWNSKKIDVIVATIAFGMGIDKPDVRYVIHYSLPKSLEGYYQETGRAGRDGKASRCILYYSFKDKNCIDFMINNGEGSSAQKETGRDSLRRVLGYCSNRVDCRRSILLDYFGEEFDRSQCRGTCDNCEKRNENIRRDYTVEARKIMACINDVTRGKNMTFLNIMNIYAGTAKSDKERAFKSSQYFGLGKGVPKADLDRIIQYLIINNILVESCVVNNAGFFQPYIKLGKMFREFQNNHNKRIVLEWRDIDVVGPNDIPRKKTQATSKNKFKTMTRKKGTTRGYKGSK
eukprot:GHVP01069574.1.p1 GENE.GHVP01069574.1~~GHVP01069574.1.p1  ORF type:complete len:802 (-),score=107.28 GHVP01069574.1:178-2583(-)